MPIQAPTGAASEVLLPRHLFGGALELQLPERFDDVSDVRPVPDHQEVFADGSEDQSLIVEIVQQADVSDAAAPSYFFDDLARANSAMSFVADSVASLSQDDVPGVPAGTPMWLVTGCQVVSKGQDQPGEGSNDSFNEVQVLLAVLRLPRVSSELLISLNSPIRIHPQSAAAPYAGAGLKDAYNNAPALFKSMLRTLRVHNWSLFGGVTAAEP